MNYSIKSPSTYWRPTYVHVTRQGNVKYVIANQLTYFEKMVVQLAFESRCTVAWRVGMHSVSQTWLLAYKKRITFGCFFYTFMTILR